MILLSKHIYKIKVFLLSCMCRKKLLVKNKGGGVAALRVLELLPGFWSSPRILE